MERSVRRKVKSKYQINIPFGPPSITSVNISDLAWNNCRATDVACVDWGESIMRSTIKTGLFALMLAAAPLAAHAGTLEGVAIGAGTGAVVAGPPGAIIGGLVGGPNIVGHHHRHCWINETVYRHCAWR
jgi:osmotically inducible lipoprotein OsmB